MLQHFSNGADLQKSEVISINMINFFRGVQAGLNRGPHPQRTADLSSSPREQGQNELSKRLITAASLLL